MADANKPSRAEKRRTKSIQTARERASSFIPIQHTQSFSGPLPRPETLAGYEQLLPGTADRIIRMTESEIEHRHSLESKAIDVQSNDLHSRRVEIRVGQIGAMLVGVTALIVAGYTATHGSPVVGGEIGGGTIISLVGAFLYRQHVVSHPPKTSEKPTGSDIAVPALLTRDEENAM